MHFKSYSLSTGFAMFSMFFGAGNVIFPLVIGHMAGEQAPYAILGLLLTAVGVPFLGLLAIILFEGRYEAFFERIGKVPGFVLTAAIMLLIGPFGGMPRCIALSYSTLKASWPHLSFIFFGLLACTFVFLCAHRKNKITTVLGSFLTPFLLGSLFVIVASGLVSAGSLQPSSLSRVEAFNFGLLEGYNTMDLLASFFFSAIIFNTLKKQLSTQESTEEKSLLASTLKASAIGAVLLSLTYIGFSLVAAYHAQDLSAYSKDQLLGALTLKILGPYAGLFASATIALACLTTAIALAAVFAEFLQKNLLKDKISYRNALFLTLICTYGVAALEFEGIVKLIFPVLEIAYPGLIGFTIINIVYKLYSMNKPKTPFITTKLVLAKE